MFTAPGVSYIVLLTPDVFISSGNAKALEIVTVSIFIVYIIIGRNRHYSLFCRCCISMPDEQVWESHLCDAGWGHSSSWTGVVSVRRGTVPALSNIRLHDW